MTINADDFAVVAGINAYPGFADLSGPINDATAFRDWLVDQNGGGVPTGNITFITSPEKNDPPIDPWNARPTSDEIGLAFRKLQARGSNNGGKAGNRLYIFLAGHGFAPDTVQPALLTANADPKNLLHIPGRFYAEWFLAMNYFNEIVLLMDCCRERYAQVPVNAPWPPRQSTAGAAQSFFYGLGCKNAARALEKPIPEDNNKVHGLFSWALLRGLSGQAPRDATGAITGTTLGRFIVQTIGALLDPSDVEQVNVMPDITTSNLVKDIVFGRVPLPKFPVTVRLTPANQGKPLQLIDGALAVLREEQPAGDAWRFDVDKPGIYGVQTKDGGASAFFQIPGAEGDNAQL